MHDSIRERSTEGQEVEEMAHRWSMCVIDPYLERRFRGLHVGP